ncbi:MAG: potassium channel family protein, partial [Acidimicrobiales bacterium]
KPSAQPSSRSPTMPMASEVRPMFSTTNEQPAVPYENFALLVLMLTASFLVTGIGDSRIVTFVAGLLNVLAVVVGFASSDVSVRSPMVITLVLVGLAGPTVVYNSPAGEIAFGLGSLAHALVLAVLSWGIVARVLRHETVTLQTILGAIAAYLLVGQVFAWLYFALPGLVGEAVLDPPAADGVPIYYSYVVLTTLGFGEITPADPIAQRFTILEALIGQVFLAVLVARLVSTYTKDD